MNEDERMDAMSKKIEDLIDSKDQLIEKLTQNLTNQHKKLLNYKNKLLDLFKKLSELKICPFDLKINENDNFACKGTDEKCETHNLNLLKCWKDWLNEQT